MNGRPPFHFAYGWNVEVERVNNLRFIKFVSVVSSSDHIQLDDTAGLWFRNNVPDFLMNPVVDHVPYRSNPFVFSILVVSLGNGRAFCEILPIRLRAMGRG